ncbi:MAG: acyl transferase [Flavobacteriaceae bacterium]|nr:acyl transferase [Flavobacteriaceae bacterium]
MTKEAVFSIQDTATFEHCAMQTFGYQYTNNMVYRRFCDYLKRNPSNVNKLEQLPFLPIDFFKQMEIKSTPKQSTHIFTSSGTTASKVSKHFISDIGWYQESFRLAFEQFYGDIESWVVLALLPSYLEREGSSLIYMVEDLIKRTNREESGFYLNDFSALHLQLKALEKAGQKTLLLGVSFALLDFASQYPMQLQHTLVMETGGMKGRREELTRAQLHAELQKGLGLQKIHSEYGMTELLSQAYSKGDGIFEKPPWMQVYIRQTEDPLSYVPHGKTGGINIIDLANVQSCSFIATQDLGRKTNTDSFEVLGRFDHSDVRGCNLMVL